MSNGYFKEKLLFSKVSEGVQLFQVGGGATFSRGGGGVHMLISIETHIPCDFSRGGLDHISPPLDPHMRFHNLFFLFQKETLAVVSQKIPLKKTIHLSTKTNVWTYR